MAPQSVVVVVNVFPFQTSYTTIVSHIKTASSFYQLCSVPYRSIASSSVEWPTIIKVDYFVITGLEFHMKKKMKKREK